MKMLRIVLSPDPLLRAPCEPCEVGDPSLVSLAQEMAATMYANNGCCLAAHQVGVQKRLIVVDCNDPQAAPDPLYLVNPEIIELKGEPVSDVEGCLSCPGIGVPITRQPIARVRYYDLQGRECEIESDGLLGWCLQGHLSVTVLF